MNKRDKIFYWVSTLWLSLGMASTGIIQIIGPDDQVQKMKALGFQPFFMTIIGIWKLLGVVAILIPKNPLLKEWAYAGFFFVMSGAVFTHLAAGDGAVEFFGPVLLLVLIIVSWYFRPVSRKLSRKGN